MLKRCLQILLILHCPMVAHALQSGEVSVKKTATGQYFLEAIGLKKDTVCSNLEAHRKTLEAWKAKVDPSEAESSAPTCQCVPSKKTKNLLCKLEATSNIPQRVKSVLGKKINSCTNGPNCFGAAAYSSGITPVPRFIGYEINSLLNSPMCKVREGAPQIGDWITAESAPNALSLMSEWGGLYKKRDIIHAAVYLDSNWVFQKQNWSDLSAYEFTSKKKAFSSYGIKSGCVYPVSTPDDAEKCRRPTPGDGEFHLVEYRYSVVYDCSSFGELKRAALEKMIPKDRIIYEQIEALLTEIQSLATTRSFDGKSTNRQVWTFSDTELSLIYSSIEIAALEAIKNDGEVKALWKIMSDSLVDLVHRALEAIESEDLSLLGVPVENDLEGLLLLRALNRLDY